jgi:hypothetical protein
MKIFSAMLVLCWLAIFASAQPTPGGYTPKAADMRIVEGKMYNRVLSTNWVTLPAAGVTLQVVDVVEGGLVVKASATTGEQMVIKHHPEEKKLAKGATITTPFRAMPVAGIKYGQQTVAAYDCGLPNTPENRKALSNGPIHAVQ